MTTKPMLNLANRHRARVITLLVLVASFSPSGRILAQGAPNAPRVPTPAEVEKSDTNPASDETLVLSPFEVRAEEDTGYQATSTLAGTRLRSDLKDLAASITVITKDFMNDVNATDLTSLLVYTAGTEVGGYGGNFSDLSNPEAGGEFNDALGQASPGTRVRGLIGADRTRNYFLTDTPMDGYNLERVELSRGANAILFGLGSPAGVINSSLISADTRRTRTNVNTSFGSYGSYRGTLDHNQVLVKDKLAVRLGTLFDNTRYRIKDAFSKNKGVTLAATYRPFKDTVIKVISEVGRSDSNRPQSRPPDDRYSWWFLAGKPVWDPVAQRGRLLGTPQAPFTTTSVITATGDRVTSPVQFLGTNMGGFQSNYQGIFYLDPNSSRFGGLNVGGGQTVDGVKGFADNAYLNAAGTALQAGGMVGMSTWADVNRNIYHRGDPLSALYSKRVMITDPNVFDFYHQMIDGPTKYEWGWWDTHNIAIEQTFLEKRAGVEVAFDKQHLDNGFVSPDGDYSLNLDVNEKLPNGAPNPNFLRPFYAAGGFKRVYSADRQATRATGYYSLDLRRMRGPAWLGQLLGRHMLQGTHARQESFNQKYGGTMWANGQDWRTFESQVGPGTLSSTARITSLVHYLGGSVANASGPGDYRAQALTVAQDPSGAPSIAVLTNQRPTSTAPASFHPWTVNNFSLISNGHFNVDDTIRNAAGYSDRTELHVNSSAFALQSHWLSDSIVTTGGWRRDQVWSYDAGLPAMNALGAADVRWDVFYPKLTRAIGQDSTNWGVVGHLPSFIRRRLPLETQISAFYNSATNFRVAPQRYTITGDALPSETGETKEYGVRISTMSGKIDFKIARYDTIADKATAGNLNGAIGELALLAGRVISRNYDGSNTNNPAGIAAFESWLDSEYGQIYRKAFASQLIPNTEVNTGKPAATYGKYAAANGDRGQIAAVSALESTGLEMELTANPTRNWRVSASATSAEAVRTNIAPELYDFIFNPTKGLLSLISGPAGSIIGTPTGASSLASTVNSGIINNGLITTFAQEGTKTDELRKWSYRGVTNYTFDGETFGGRLKGFSVGGALRWGDRPLLGYAGKTIVSGGTTLAISDVTRPFFGPREYTVDLNCGYGHRVWRNIDWKVRLFVKNVGVGNELRPLAVNPDGQVMMWMIKEPQKWTLTNSFTF